VRTLSAFLPVARWRSPERVSGGASPTRWRRTYTLGISAGASLGAGRVDWLGVAAHRRPAAIWVAALAGRSSCCVVVGGRAATATVLFQLAVSGLAAKQRLFALIIVIYGLVSATKSISILALADWSLDATLDYPALGRLCRRGRVVVGTRHPAEPSRGT